MSGKHRASQAPDRSLPPTTPFGLLSAIRASTSNIIDHCKSPFDLYGGLDDSQEEKSHILTGQVGGDTALYIGDSCLHVADSR